MYHETLFSLIIGLSMETLKPLRQQIKDDKNMNRMIARQEYCC